MKIRNFTRSVQPQLGTPPKQLKPSCNPDCDAVTRRSQRCDWADSRFVWNRHVLGPLVLQPELHRYALPLMHGFVGIRVCYVAGIELKLVLVSRRSWYRAGTRFNVRGVDEHGHAANFVETEQIIEMKNYLCSFVQIRGSIPLFWSQKPDLKWQPTPKLREEDTEQMRGFRSHMGDLEFQYPGTHVLVNLINSKGREKRLGERMKDIVYQSGLQNTEYIYFDFHKECKNMNWERISILLNQCRPSIEKFEFFASRVDVVGEGMNQSGYFRTNCIDCLDRTNVIQSMIAKESLIIQLKWLKILKEEELPDEKFEAIFKNLWADNGDYCSLQYAGTGALKADFTRLGKRTYLGSANDARNALTRYFKNNFSDGERQDAIDLFLGNHVVEGTDTPTKYGGATLDEWMDWRGIVFLFAVIAFFMVILTLLVSTEYTYPFLFFWFALLVILGSVIYFNGEEFVNKPKLKAE